MLCVCTEGATHTTARERTTSHEQRRDEAKLSCVGMCTFGVAPSQKGVVPVAKLSCFLARKGVPSSRQLSEAVRRVAAERVQFCTATESGRVVTTKGMEIA